MRTTLTLEPEVADYLKTRARLEDKSFKEVVNELLKRGMSQQSTPPPNGEPFQVRPHRGGFRAGVDLLKLNQAADDLEADDFLAETSPLARR